MVVYTSMILCTVLISIGIKKNENNKKLFNIYKIFTFLLPFLILAIRYGIGVDYFNTYVPVFEAIKNYGTYANIEIGYIILNKIVLLFTSDYAGIFILTSFIFCYLTFKSIFDNSINVPLSILILLTGGLYFYSMNAVRQSIVTAIFLFAIKYIKEKKFIKYCFFIILAATIHKTALIFLPLYFLCQIKLDFKKITIFTILIIVCMPIIPNIIEWLVQDTKYINYINGIYSSYSKPMASVAINMLIVILCIIYQGKKDKQYDKTLQVYFNIHLVALWTSFFIGRVPLFNRIFLEVFHTQIFTIPYLISKQKNKNAKTIITFVCILLYAILFIYSIGIQNGNNVLPYTTIFNR